MKVLLINKFLYPKGGDAVSTLNTGRLLAERGHEVHYWGMRHPSNPPYPHQETFVAEKDYLRRASLRQTLRQGLQVLYSFEAKAQVERVLALTKPDLVHVNNFAHQISPSILHVFRRHRLPVVMTMHDFKLVCPVYSLFTDGRPCQRCQGGRYWWCVAKKCAKGSVAKSLLATLEMYLHHDLLRVYDLIDLYLAPSRFMQRTLREMGFHGKVEVLPNFIAPVPVPSGDGTREPVFVYFGRLAPGKGLLTLLEAVASLEVTLKIIGDGPLREEMERFAQARGARNVRFLGYLQGDDLRREVQESLAVVHPAEAYENLPMSILESFALGRPVIGARIGGIPELVRDGKTGLTFEPGDAEDLRRKVLQLKDRPEEAAAMGRAGREAIEREYGPETYYRALLALYQQALDLRRQAHPVR